MKGVCQKFQNFNWQGHRIHGEWCSEVSDCEEKTAYNPNNRQAIASVKISKSIVSKAVDVAYESKNKLLGLSFEDKMVYLKKLNSILGDSKKDIISAMRVEVGKAQWEAESDFIAARRYLTWVYENKDVIYRNLLAATSNYNVSGKLKLQPAGVVVAYFSFSSPITTFVSYMSSIIISGCSVVFFVPTQNILFGSIIAGFDERIKFLVGSFNVVFGDFEYFRHTLLDRRVSAVMFTGSKEHCEKIQRTSTKSYNRKLILQSGGKNSVIVHSSADIDLAVKGVVLGVIKSAGQLCSSTSRVFVARECFLTFKKRLAQAFKNILIGPTDVFDNSQGPLMGPLYSEKSLEKFLRFQTMAQREAQETLMWGCAVENQDFNGFFVRPGLHLFEKINIKSAYQSNVLFSPDLALYEYKELEEAIEATNMTESSLCVSFYGKSCLIEERGHLFFTPNIMVNLPTVEVEALLPLAPRGQWVQHNSQGVGVVLDLCCPQVLVKSAAQEAMIAKWPAVL